MNLGFMTRLTYVSLSILSFLLCAAVWMVDGVPSCECEGMGPREVKGEVA